MSKDSEEFTQNSRDVNIISLILSLMISIHMINIQNGMSKSLVSYLATSVGMSKRLDSCFILVCSFFGELMTTGGLWTSTEGKRAPILPGDNPGLKYPGEPTDDLPLTNKHIRCSFFLLVPNFLFTLAIFLNYLFDQIYVNSKIFSFKSRFAN